MIHPQTYDVVISGGGILGMLCGVLLAQVPLKVAILEANHILDELDTLNNLESGQIFSLTPVSVQLLKNVGVWDLLHQAQVNYYDKIFVQEMDLGAKIQFNANKNDASYLGAIVAQNNLLQALAKKIKRINNLTYFSRAKICDQQTTSTRVRLTLEPKQTIEAKFCVIAEGWNSSMRTMLEIPAQETDYHQTAMVSVLKTELPHCNQAFQFFHRTGPLAFLPLADQNRVAMIWSQDNEAFGINQAFELQVLQQKIMHLSDAMLGHVSFEQAVRSFPIMGRHVKRYFAHRCVLIGDSAHRIHPLAGLGANLGMLDVAHLYEVVSKACKKGRDLGHDAVLLRYHQRRWFDNEKMYWLMKWFKEGFGSQSSTIRTVLFQGLTCFDKLAGIKQLFSSQASQTGVNLPKIASRLAS